MMKKKLPILIVLFISLILVGCTSKGSTTNKESVSYVNVGYEEAVAENIRDGVYLFSREDCPSCIDLLGLIDGAFDDDKSFFDNKEINIIETSHMSEDEKANLGYMYDLTYVPRLIKIKNNEIIYDKTGGFSQDNIKGELSKAFKAK